MYKFKTRKVLTLLLITALVLLTATTAAAICTQNQNQNTNPIIFQMLLQHMNIPANQPISSKAIVWTDRTINSPENYNNEEIIVYGNLIIASGGSLSLTNVTLRVDEGGEPLIPNVVWVQSGGAIYINDTDGNPNTKNDASNITSLNPPERYRFWADPGSVFQMNNSELHYCGSIGGLTKASGLWINTNNTIIENNTITNCNTGIVLYDSHHNRIRNNNITNNDYFGINMYQYSSNNSIIGNTFSNSRYGFYTNYPTNSNISSNIISNQECGFVIVRGSNSTFANNLVLNNQWGFWMVMASQHNITGNTVINNDYGFGLENSWGNNITDNIVVNSQVYGFYLNESSAGNRILDNTALNSTIRGYNWTDDCVDNNFTGSVEANYLRVNVTDVLGYPIQGADVRVETDGAMVYRTPHFGGSDSSTDENGLTPLIIVRYLTFANDTIAENITTVTVYYQDFPIVNNDRTVSMASSHIEIFQVTDNVDPVVYITVPVNDSITNTGVIWVNGTFNGTGSNVMIIGINDIRFTLVEPPGPPYGLTGTYSFTASGIGTSEFYVEIIVEDGAGNTATATRHIIVVQPSPIQPLLYTILISSNQAGVSPLIIVVAVAAVGVAAVSVLYYLHFRKV